MTAQPGHPRTSAQPDVASVNETLRELAGNYRWVWDEPTQRLFHLLDPETWERTRDPFAVLDGVPPDRLAGLATRSDFGDQLTAAHDDLTTYLADTPPRADIAYFCMEHGIAPPLRTYAGGLGMLAGCIEKTASDLGVPMVAVGLLYRWWFRQKLRFGWQEEEWTGFDPGRVGLRRCPEGRVTVDLAGQPVTVDVWRARVGRVDLYLLDTDIDDNPPEVRGVTDRLYGGDAEHRLRQELILGVGGVRALAALGLDPKVYHANEGHAGFMQLERIRREITTGRTLDEAVEAVRAATIFTTHTAVPAGFDLFSRELIGRYLGGWAATCGVGLDWLMDLGHFPGQDRHEPFNMAVLCARLAAYINAVSRLHREVTEQRVLGPLWPGRAAPIRCVTNGVHPRTWTPPEMSALYGRYVGADWDYAGPDRWQRVWNIPNDELWHARQTLRARLVDHIRRYLPGTLAEMGWQADLDWAGQVLDPHALTVVVARRAAEYKETDLLVSSPDRLRDLVNDPDRPVNVIFSGLAHPKDEGGKRRIQHLVDCSLGTDLRHRVVYLPGYDMRLALALLGGADVWLNHPRRGDEACGTSFMKSVYSGGRVLSTADGGADELLVDGDNGWVIGDRRGGASREEMADDAYALLTDTIRSEFHDRDASGVPGAWLDGVRRSLGSLAWQVSSAPMVRAYARLSRDAVRRARHPLPRR